MITGGIKPVIRKVVKYKGSLLSINKRDLNMSTEISFSVLFSYHGVNSLLIREELAQFNHRIFAL